MKSFTTKYPKTTLLLANVILIGLLIILIECILHCFSPFYNSVRPTIFPQHYYQYGWGNFPNERIYFVNPDTGEQFSERTNNKGWRDKNRSFKNENNSYRILILGDSEAFGALVKQNDRYPIVLENLMKEKYNAEVISLTGVGWGTDQILEALQNEGFKYQPDLVIVPFNHNDLADNIYYQISQKNSKGFFHKSYKPFYYDVDSNNQLVRKENENFYVNSSNTFSSKLKVFLFKHSEIAKRFYSYLHRSENKFFDFSPLEFDAQNVPLTVNELNLQRFKMVFKIADSTEIISDLNEFETQNLSNENLINVLKKHNFSNPDSIKTATTIFKDIYFQNHWRPEFYKPSIPDTTQLEWQVIYRLLDKIQETTSLNNTDLAVIPCFEEGAADFLTSWHWLHNDSTSKANFLQNNVNIADYCNSKDIPFIDPKEPLQRANNDLHMNEIGNATIAKELYQYITTEKATALQQYLKD